MEEVGEFLLRNFECDTSIQLSIGDCKIGIENIEQNIEELNNLQQKIVGIASSKLIIKGSHQEELTSLAVDIKNLLSIANGRRAIFNKSVFWNGHDKKVIENPMAENSNNGNSIIPNFEIESYLKQTLPTWRSLKKNEQDDLFTIIDYLNQTNNDFIEDRLLRTVQAWECAAYYWIEPVELTDELKDLRSRIKQTYNSWKKELNYDDPNGELGSRLTAPFERDKLVLHLEKLIDQYGLITDKINLDLKRLKLLRDKVAHTGRIPFKGQEVIEDLKSGVFGLQLILLRKLGFEGKIYGSQDGCRSVDELSAYFQ